MGVKDIKAEARHKLPLNVHLAIMVYAVEYVVLATLIALIVLACVCMNTIHIIAAVVMICYGVAIFLVAVVAFGMLDFAMVDYYLASYKSMPYNVRRLGETLAKSRVTNVLKLNIVRTLLGFLLLLCLIVPGVIYLVRTSMANHLLIANPKMDAMTALKASNKIMSGRTGEYLALQCSFIGWWLLGIITLGLGFVVIAPYSKLAKTVYYKRKLQGDKGNYNVDPQAYGFVMQAPSENLAGGQFVQPEAKGGKRKRQSGDVSPNDTLAAHDVEDMNAAMRDVAGMDVREVAIPDISNRATDLNIQTVPVAEQPIQNVEPTEVSNFTESSKTLSLEEMRQVDAMNRKIDEMFAQSARPQEDYSARPQSDEAFDAFMNGFDVPNQSGQFKPLTRTNPDVPSVNGDFGADASDGYASSVGMEYVSPAIESAFAPDPEPTAEASNGRQARQERIARQREQRAADQPSSRRASVRTTARASGENNQSSADQTDRSETPEDRLARLRKERQERINNLRK